jgi:hypothetical protein
MPKITHFNLAGAWREIKNAYVKVAGTWRDVYKIYVKVSGVWEEVHRKQIDYTITSDVYDFDAHVALGSQTTPYDFVVTVDTGINVRSSGTGIPAFSAGALPAGSTLKIVNKGNILGRGGRGADVTEIGITAWGCIRGVNGLPGGDAIETTVDVEIDNTLGNIYGGGGGGAAGGSMTGPFDFFSWAGGGGGAGAGGDFGGRTYDGGWGAPGLDATDGEDSSGIIDLVLDTTLEGAAETSVVVTSPINEDTPQSGFIRITANALDTKIIQAYTSWTDYTFTIPSSDYSSQKCNAGNQVSFSSGYTKTDAAGAGGNPDSYDPPDGHYEGGTGGAGGGYGDNGENSLVGGDGEGSPLFCSSGPDPDTAGATGGTAGKAVELNGNSISWLGGNNSNQVKGAVS